MALVIQKKIDPSQLDSNAKGDLLVNTGTDITALPVGTDGQVIKADSTTTEGVVYEAENYRYEAPPAITYTAPGIASAGSNTDDLFYALGVDQNGGTVWANPAGTSVLTVDEYDVKGGTLVTGNLSNATDRDTGTLAFSSVTFEEGLQFDFGTTGAFELKTLYHFGDSTQGFEVFGSNDAVSWTSLGQIGVVGWSELDTSLNTTAYRYYFMQHTGGGTSGRIFEVEFYGIWYPPLLNDPVINLPIISDYKNSRIATPGAGGQIEFDNGTSLGFEEGDFVEIVHTKAGTYTFLATAGDPIVNANAVVLETGTAVKVYYLNDEWHPVIDQAEIIGTGSPLVNTGDIYIFGTTNEPLNVGNDGQIVIADSNESKGLKYGNANRLFLETKIEPGNILFSTNGFNGIINAVGTVDGTETYVNPYNGPLDVRVKLGSGATTNGDRATNHILAGGGAVAVSIFYSPGSGQEVVWIDFAQAEFVRPTVFSFYISSFAPIGGTDTFKYFTVEGSDNNADWTVISNQLDVFGVIGSVNQWYNISITDTTNFWRYLRLRYYNDDTSPGTGGISQLTEVEVYGEYITTIPTGTLAVDDIGKLLISSDTSNTYSLKVPDNTGQFVQGWYCYVKSGTGNNPTVISAVNLATINSAEATASLSGPEQLALLVNTDGANQWSFVKLDRDIPPKGGLLTGDGTNEVILAAGTTGQVLTANTTTGTGFEYVNVNTLVDNPFSAQATTATGDITLTSASPRYQYIDPDSTDRDVVLTDPPTTNDFFFIVNSTGNALLNIKETSAGGIQATLTNAGDSVQCHYVGAAWQIIIIN